jgi:esterase FrsA
MIAADLFPITRTLEELKTEAQARADRNGYPLAGLQPEEVREALSKITSLDRDEWAAAWSAIGDRHATRADALPAGSAQARTEYMAAWRYYSFARWPVPIGSGKERAYRKALDAFVAASRSLDPALRIVRIPFEGKEIVGYLRLPKNVKETVPLVIGIGGLDSRKEDMIERFSVLLPRGIGALGLDMPGTGEAPLRIGPNAERMFSAVIDHVLTYPEIDPLKIIIYGGSFGGHWGVRLAVTERQRLLGVIVQSGPIHTAFAPDFLEKAFVTKEYLFDRGPAIASMYDGVTTPSELLAAAPKNSLLTQGYLEKPMAQPMLVIAGEHDTQVPISDINLLLHSGTPKWSWINPNGGHMGREAKGWVDPVIFAKVTIPWIMQTLEAARASS